MIVIEFVVFVVSSGLFYNERFRHNIWAWIFAGGIATASSLLFVYHLVAMFAFEAPAQQTAPAKIQKQIVQVPVPEKINRTPEASGRQDCRDDYPLWSRIWGQEGTTVLSFLVRADGLVKDVKVTQSSGYDRLDDAATECVTRWHYKPGIKDSILTDMPWTATVVWSMGSDTGKPADDKSSDGETNSDTPKDSEQQP